MSKDLLRQLSLDLKNAKGTAKDMPPGKADYPIGDFSSKKKTKALKEKLDSLIKRANHENPQH